MGRRLIPGFPLGLLWLVLCAPAGADTFGPFDIVESRPVSEFWGNAGFYSYHFQKEKGLNNNNSGLGLEYRYSNVSSVTLGSFYNSDRKTSHYAGVYWQPLAIGAVRFGAALGGFDGYPRMHDSGWFLAVIPVASVDYERISMNLVFIPTYKDRLYGALSAQLKLRLD